MNEQTTQLKTNIEEREAAVQAIETELTHRTEESKRNTARSADATPQTDAKPEDKEEAKEDQDVDVLDTTRDLDEESAESIFNPQSTTGKFFLVGVLMTAAAGIGYFAMKRKVD